MTVTLTVKNEGPPDGAAIRVYAADPITGKGLHGPYDSHLLKPGETGWMVVGDGQCVRVDESKPFAQLRAKP